MTFARTSFSAQAPILVAVALRGDDGAPVALGRRLARLTGAPLVLATILDEAGAEPDTALEAMAAPLRAEHDVRMRSVHAPTAAAGLHALVCDEQAAALVIGSTHHRKIRRHTPEGVTAWSLRGVPCSVAVAPRGDCDPRAPLRRIGAAFADSSEGHDVVAAAVELAALAGGSVRIFTALDLPSGGPPSDGADERERASAAVTARRGRERVPVELRVGSEVLVGPPAETLGCASHEFDLLVCGAHGFGSAQETTGPSVESESHDVVDRAFCAVLLVPRADHPAAAPPPAPESATFVTK